jgi:hypothetical protein
LTRNTAKPDSALWKVTRSTRPEMCSAWLDTGEGLLLAMDGSLLPRLLLPFVFCPNAGHPRVKLVAMASLPFPQDRRPLRRSSMAEKVASAQGRARVSE